jgi:hypothetical protein
MSGLERGMSRPPSRYTSWYYLEKLKKTVKKPQSE